MKYNETPVEARKLLVEALRSGKYQQGHGRLTVGDKYCCLGVACKLFTERYPDYITVKTYGDCPTVHYQSEVAQLPTDVANWLGFHGLLGGLNVPVNSNHIAGCRNYSLAELNDIEKYTFDQIADLIEQGGVETVD